MTVPAAVLMINSTTIDRNATDTRLVRLVGFRRGSDGELTLARRGLTLSAVATPDPWWGQPVTLAIGGTTYFTGLVARGSQHHDTGKFGWVREHVCRDLPGAADYR